MAGSTTEWQRYELWNEAIATVVFPREVAGVPVYLDLEDDILATIRDMAEPGGGDPATTLIKVTKDTLVLRDGKASVLRGHINRLRIWHDGTMLDPPPTLAVLATLSLAAETMHAGEGMKPHNFWGRFKALLELDESQLNWFRDAYRDRSAMLWESLNHWLEMLEGERGLPTARALGHEHIGFPLSQALVRQTDRDHLSELFAFNSLPPRSTLAAFDMELLLNEWMARTPCPASTTLENLWKSSQDARARITEVSLQTLESWDGTSTLVSRAGTAPPVLDLVKARVVLRTFPSTRIDISFVLPARTEGEVELVEILDPNGQVLDSLELAPVASGYLGPADSSLIDVASLLVGEALLRRPSADQPLRRRSRPVVPLRYDELLQSFVECERVQLGEESLLLVRSHPGSSVPDLVSQAKSVLEVVARPGFTLKRSMPGLPEGWALFTGVQVLSSIPAAMRSQIRVDLNVLQPIATSQVVLQGGLRLPGNIAKWSSGVPPELRVTDEVGSLLSATLTCTRPLAQPTPEDRKQDGTGEVLIWNIADEYLPDGDYQITVFDDKEQIKTETLRLRSADNPAVVVDTEAPIAHLPDRPGFGLMAFRTEAASAFQGVPAERLQVPTDLTVPKVPDWYDARKELPRRDSGLRTLRFPTPDDKSCMVTGSHLMSIETVKPGMTSAQGVCQQCGLVRRFPTRGKKRSSATRAKVPVAPRINVADLPPVEPVSAINWSFAFDAACHVGKGRVTALDRIAAQLEATDLFVDAFRRRLDMLSHIEIHRSPTSFEASTFDVVEPDLYGLLDGSAVLIGFRSERLLSILEDLTMKFHGQMTTEPMTMAPPLVRITQLSESDLHDLAASAEDASGRTMRFVPDAAIHLASTLPPFRTAARGLPKTQFIQGRSTEKWDPISAQFRDAVDTSSTGAFRLTGFKRTYIHRSSADIESMQATLGDAQIVKYLSALDARRSLLGYDALAKVLYVPLGADIPGLYGRAAVLASGRPPVENLNERILEYHGVSPDLAALLDHLLMSES